MSRHRTLILFVAATVLFGIPLVSTRAVIGSAPSVLFAAFRVGIAAIVFLTLIATRGGYQLPWTRADTPGILTSTAFVLGANNVPLSLGRQHATTGTAAVMYSIMPVIFPVFVVLPFDDAHTSAVDAAGILLRPVGVVVIVGSESVLGGGSVGQTLIVYSMLPVVSGAVPLRRVGPSIGTPPQTTRAMVAAAVGIHAVGLGLGEPVAQIAWSPELITVILYVSMPTTAVAYPIYSTLLSEAGPVRGDSVAYTMSVVVTVTNRVFFGEAVSPATVLGFGVILLGFLLMQYKSVARFVGLRESVLMEAE